MLDGTGVGGRAVRPVHHLKEGEVVFLADFVPRSAQLSITNHFQFSSDASTLHYNEGTTKDRVYL